MLHCLHNSLNRLKIFCRQTNELPVESIDSVLLSLGDVVELRTYCLFSQQLTGTDAKILCNHLHLFYGRSASALNVIYKTCSHAALSASNSRLYSLLGAKPFDILHKKFFVHWV